MTETGHSNVEKLQYYAIVGSGSCYIPSLFARTLPRPIQSSLQLLTKGFCIVLSVWVIQSMVVRVAWGCHDNNNGISC